jgi:predicted DNA-binding protein YlxM (UPF0122 family)
MKKSALSSRQMRTITCILENNSIEEAAKKASVSRSTIYNWLRQDHFKDRLEQERKALFDEGLSTLKGATAKAAKKMVELLNSTDENIRRLTSKEIINVALKVVEIKKLEERVDHLEELLKKSQRRF